MRVMQLYPTMLLMCRHLRALMTTSSALHVSLSIQCLMSGNGFLSNPLFLHGDLWTKKFNNI